MTLLESVQAAHDARDTIQGLLYELERTRNLLYRVNMAAGVVMPVGTVVCPEDFEFTVNPSGEEQIILSGFNAPKELNTTYQRLAAKARELMG